MQYHNFDLENRLIRFAIEVLNLTERLPNTVGSRVLANQLARSSTSIALNYGEVQANESPKDFIHKMSICLKELRESLICIKIIQGKPYFQDNRVLPVLQECNELLAIFYTSIKTKRKNMNS